MFFENQEIDISGLPHIAEATFQKLSRNYVSVRYIGNTIFFLLLLGGLFGVYLETPIVTDYPTLWYALLAFWCFWMITSFILVKLGYDIRGYVLREKDIVHRKGVLYKSTTTIPFNRVQHCEISQGPIQRMFDLHTLEIFTAGGSKSDLAIPGLHGETAQQIKEFIVKKTVIAEEEANILEQETERVESIEPIASSDELLDTKTYTDNTSKY